MNVSVLNNFISKHFLRDNRWNNYLNHDDRTFLLMPINYNHIKFVSSILTDHRYNILCSYMLTILISYHYCVPRRPTKIIIKPTYCSTSLSCANFCAVRLKLFSSKVKLHQVEANGNIIVNNTRVYLHTAAAGIIRVHSVKYFI